MKIRSITAAELKSCYELESSYDSRADNAPEQGFFLPGATLSLYEDIYRTGFLRGIFDDQGLCSFIAVLPPKHETIAKLLTNPGMDLETAPEKAVFWIAKVATRDDCRLKGYARALYKDVFNSFPDHQAMTATAFGPLRNYSSENFHQSLGMTRCGVFKGGTRGHLENTVNIVWRT